MKYIKTMLLFVMITTLTSCTNLNINNKILDQKKAEEISIKKDLLTIDDFDNSENPYWIKSISKDERVSGEEDKSINEHMENEKKEKEILEKLKQSKINTENIILVLNKDGFLVILNENDGKVYLYNDEKVELQFLMDADYIENDEDYLTTDSGYFLRANIYKDTLYLGNKSNLYLYDRVGSQIKTMEVPEDFNLVQLNNNYGVFSREDNRYIFLYSSNSIEYVLDREFFNSYYYDYYISQNGNTIYCIDILNKKLYSYTEDGIENMRMAVASGRDRIKLFDKDKEFPNFKEFKILLPKL